MGFAQSGIKEAVMIEYLCHRPDRRTWITVNGFLIDRNGGTQPFYMFHPRFFRLTQKLSGIGREGFDKPTLTLLENRVKCQRRFPGTTYPGKHRKGVPGQGQVDVFQVVLGCSNDHNFVRRSIHFNELACFDQDRVSIYMREKYFLNLIRLKSLSLRFSKEKGS